ncbi:MAG: hypothetical protein RLZZ447_512, partial [Verrucomicrobiota bacterium]
MPPCSTPSMRALRMLLPLLLAMTGT